VDVEQLPQLHLMLTETCALLGVAEAPRLYVKFSLTPAAYAPTLYPTVVPFSTVRVSYRPAADSRLRGSLYEHFVVAQQIRLP
jgi:hypothetical protein